MVGDEVVAISGEKLGERFTVLSIGDNGECALVTSPSPSPSTSAKAKKSKGKGKEAPQPIWHEPRETLVKLARQ